MATTVTNKGVLSHTPYLIRELELSTIEPGETVDASFSGPDGAKVGWILHEVKTEATSGDPVISVEHIAASDSLTNNTVRVRVKTTLGGDLTGAVVRVLVFFIEQGSGGVDTNAP